jgi:hypothetical protein
MGVKHKISKRMLAERQGSICPWCNLPLPGDLAETDRDHIIPRCRGGGEQLWNRQLLHTECNRGAGGKNRQLTTEAIALATKYGILLCEPGALNPCRAQMRPPGPPPHQVTVRKLYEVGCLTCGGIIAAEDSWEKAQEAKRDHIARARADHANEPAA